MENLTGLEPNGRDFRFYLKYKCSSCGEIPDHWQHVTLEEHHPLKGGRGDANIVIKCKLCGRENSCSIIEEETKPYLESDNNQFKTVAVFDCRGMEPVEFDPRDGWKVKGFKNPSEDDDEEEGKESGTVFEEVDLSDEWADYDEASNESVCISEFKFQFVKIH